MSKPQTVEDLIKQLQTMDPKAIPLVTTSNFEQGQSLVPITYVGQYDSGECKKQTFRDAFDGGTYSKEVWSTSGGKKKVVMLS